MLAFFLEILMNQVEVEILGQVITAQHGTLKTGDILRTDPAFAKHLVEDCSAAKYVNAPEPVPAPEPEPEPEPHNPKKN